MLRVNCDEGSKDTHFSSAPSAIQMEVLGQEWDGKGRCHTPWQKTAAASLSEASFATINLFLSSRL